MANWGWGSLVDLLKLGAGAALTATGIGAGAGLPMIAGSVGMGLSGAGGLAGSASAPSDEELEDMIPTRTGYMPPPSRFSGAARGPSPMARYAPQNRQPQSGVDPEIMQYLMRYMRPR